MMLDGSRKGRGPHLRIEAWNWNDSILDRAPKAEMTREGSATELHSGSVVGYSEVGQLRVRGTGGAGRHSSNDASPSGFRPASRIRMVSELRVAAAVFSASRIAFR